MKLSDITDTAMRRFPLFLFLLPFAAAVAFAQGGSNYSAFGLGDLHGSVSAAYEGLGGASIAVPSRYALGGVNPATWSFISTTRLQTGFSLRQAHITTDNASIDQNSGKLQGIAGVFAVDTALGISFGFGLKPFSTISYMMERPTSLTVDGSTLSATSLYEGKGGLTTAYFGGTFRPIEDVTLGITALYHFGKLTSTITTDFDDSDYLSAALQSNDGLSGSGFNIGAIYSGIPNLYIGAVVTANLPLSITTEDRYASSVSADTTIETTSETDMPLSIGVGASYVTGKFLITGEFTTADFSKLALRKPAFVSFRRTNSISVGASKLSDTKASSFLDRCAYNFGAGFNQQYYVVNNQNIDEMYASFGIQAPVARNTYIDAAITGGMRGTTNSGLMQELFARLSFTISIGETWFQPFKRD